MTRLQTALVRSLLEAHLTNLRGHQAAIDEIPELMLIADEGWSDIEAQIALTESTLASLNGELARA